MKISGVSGENTFVGEIQRTPRKSLEGAANARRHFIQ